MATLNSSPGRTRQHLGQSWGLCTPVTQIIPILLGLRRKRQMQALLGSQWEVSAVLISTVEPCKPLSFTWPWTLLPFKMTHQHSPNALFCGRLCQHLHTLSLSPTPHVADAPLPVLTVRPAYWKTPAECSLRRQPVEMLIDSLLALSMSRSLSLFFWIFFSVFKTQQSVYCRITAIVCFKFDSCFIQLPSVEAAR